MFVGRAAVIYVLTWQFAVLAGRFPQRRHSWIPYFQRKKFKKGLTYWPWVLLVCMCNGVVWVKFFGQILWTPGSLTPITMQFAYGQYIIIIFFVIPTVLCSHSFLQLWQKSSGLLTLTHESVLIPKAILEFGVRLQVRFWWVCAFRSFFACYSFLLSAVSLP